MCELYRAQRRWGEAQLIALQVAAAAVGLAFAHAGSPRLAATEPAAWAKAAGARTWTAARKPTAAAGRAGDEASRLSAARPPQTVFAAAPAAIILGQVRRIRRGVVAGGGGGRK